MAEVLSQSQIDALLAAAMSGGQDLSQKEEKKYQKYDFRSPRKYTKERLKMLNGVFENYAKVLNTRINALARATCEVEVDTVDEQRYYEFSNALIDGEVVTLAYLNINGDIEETPVIIVATPSIMVSLIDRLMGGGGARAQRRRPPPSGGLRHGGALQHQPPGLRPPQHRRAAQLPRRGRAPEGHRAKFRHFLF